MREHRVTLNGIELWVEMCKVGLADGIEAALQLTPEGDLHSVIVHDKAFGSHEWRITPKNARGLGHAIWISAQRHYLENERDILKAVGLEWKPFSKRRKGGEFYDAVAASEYGAPARL